MQLAHWSTRRTNWTTLVEAILILPHAYSVDSSPRRLGTIPLRALVPRLKGQMALSNGMKLALDWLGLALDLLGLALIDHFWKLEN